MTMMSIKYDVANLWNLKFAPELTYSSCMKHMYKGEIIKKHKR